MQHGGAVACMDEGGGVAYRHGNEVGLKGRTKGRVCALCACVCVCAAGDVAAVPDIATAFIAAKGQQAPAGSICRGHPVSTLHQYRFYGMLYSDSHIFKQKEA